VFQQQYGSALSHF